MKETIGCFHVEHLGGERWRFTNIKTDISHIYYGTYAEVVESAQRQTEGWVRRTAGKGKGILMVPSFNGPPKKT